MKINDVPAIYSLSLFMFRDVTPSSQALILVSIAGMSPKISLEIRKNYSVFLTYRQLDALSLFYRSLL